MRESFVFNDGELVEGARFSAEENNIIQEMLASGEQGNGIVLQLMNCEVRHVSADVAPKKLRDLVWLIKPGDIFLVVPFSKEASTGWLFVHQIGGIVILPMPIR